MPAQANPRRVAKVASQIQREISDLFVTDPVSMLQLITVAVHGCGDLCLSLPSVWR
jgi:hypothetical protein